MEGLWQPSHLLLILVVVLILFGPGKLPDIGRGLGKSIREFKDAMKGDSSKDASVPPEKKGEPAANIEKSAGTVDAEATKV